MFRAKSYFCWIAKFGEDILNRGRTIYYKCMEYFQYGRFDVAFWTEKLKETFGAHAEYMPPDVRF